MMSAARVGLQRAVVWKRLYLSPSAASLSSVGDGIPPPKVEYCPNPVSSSKIRTTFGAPLGAFTGWGNCGGSESLYVLPTLPWNLKSGLGSTFGVPSIAAESGFCPWPSVCVSRPDATCQPSSPPTAIITAFAVIDLFMLAPRFTAERRRGPTSSRPRALWSQLDGTRNQNRRPLRLRSPDAHRWH